MTGPRTVLYVQQYPDGGSITGLLDVIRGLDPDRYRPVVSFRTDNAFVGEFEAAGAAVEVLDPSVPSAMVEDPSTGRVPLPASSTGPGPVPVGSSVWRREARRVLRRDLPSARRLCGVIRRHHVDLVHANNDVLSNRDAILAAMATRRPVVVHGRGLHAYAPDATLRIDRLLARRPARFFFMSQAVAVGCEELDIPADRQLVLDDPFDVDDYDVVVPPGLDHELGLPEGARVVLHIGRIIDWKGQDVFLRALAEALPAHPDAVGLLVGAPTDRRGRIFHDELVALADELGITDRVVFAGARRDVPELIARSEAVVHCSTLAEPFGRVVVEAMAGRRAVIGADGGGVPEIIDAGETGLLVAPGDPMALGAAISGVLADPTATAEMGERARAAVGARFTIEAHATALQAAYDAVLSADGS